jgi:hypothetical protein
MCRVAKDYLMIPAAEVSVKRLFSEWRYLRDLRQHSMSPETIKAEMLSQHKY